MIRSDRFQQAIRPRPTSHPTRPPGQRRLSSTIVTVAIVAVAIVGCGLSIAGCGTRAARPGTDEEPKQAAQDAGALKSLGNREWFDASRKDYRPPLVAADPDIPVRRTGVQAGPDPQKAASSSKSWWSGFRMNGSVFGYTVLISLGVVLVLMAVVLIAISARTWASTHARKNMLLQSIEIDPARVVDLPFEAASEMQDPLAYAKQLIAEGRFDEAIIYIYGYMLLGLDRAGKIFLHRGKTNRMYLQELAREGQLKQILSPAVLAYEDVFFGRHAIDRPRFEMIWNNLTPFHEALASAIAATLPVEEAVPS